MNDTVPLIASRLAQLLRERGHIGDETWYSAKQAAAEKNLLQRALEAVRSNANYKFGASVLRKGLEASDILYDGHGLKLAMAHSLGRLVEWSLPNTQGSKILYPNAHGIARLW